MQVSRSWTHQMIDFLSIINPIPLASSPFIHSRQLNPIPLAPALHSSIQGNSNKTMGIYEEIELPSPSLPLLSLNHVSFLCKSVSDTAKFYQEVLGFVLIKRPSSFKFEGAWLFNYGIGIHLLQCNSAGDIREKPIVINPKDNHISFQCSDMDLVKRKLKEMGMEYVTAVVEEGGVKVDQLFFHDPDGYMIEICNCDNLPVLPLSPCPLKSAYIDSSNRKLSSLGSMKVQCAVDVETQMMENLILNMIDFTM